MSRASHNKSRASLLDHRVFCIQLSYAGYSGSPDSQEYREMVPVMPVDDERSEGSASTKVATLGGGCFWCPKAVFEELWRVQEVLSGYSGSTVPDPTYEQVCTSVPGPPIMRRSYGLLSTLRSSRCG